MVVATCHEVPGSRQEERTRLFAPVAPGRNKKPPPRVDPRTRHEVATNGQVWGVGLKKFEAENLLDWLEANGRVPKLALVIGKGFTVWQAKP